MRRKDLLLIKVDTLVKMATLAYFLSCTKFYTPCISLFFFEPHYFKILETVTYSYVLGITVASNEKVSFVIKKILSLMVVGSISV